MTPHETKKKALALLKQGRSRLQVCTMLGIAPGELSGWIIAEKRKQEKP